MNKSIPSVCFLGGGATGSGAPAGGGSMSMPTPQLSAPTQQPGQQGQAIPGLTMPTLQDIMAGGSGPAQGMVQSPMPQTHGAANQSLIAAILKML